MRRLTAFAAVAGGLVLANHLVARAAERRHPPRGRFISVDDVRLHYTDIGEGFPIVLLHGNGAMAEDFAVSGVQQRLARAHRVIAVDRPGFGFSNRPRRKIWTARAQADLIHRAIRQLGVERPVIVGHSWGALVALAIALDHPADTAGLALLSGPILPESRADIRLATVPAMPILGDLLTHTVWPLLGRLIWRRLAEKLFEPASLSERFQRDFPTGLALRPSQLHAGAADLALLLGSAEALSARAGSLAVPVLVLTGTGDTIVDPKRQAIPLQQIVGGELCLIAGAGHMVHHTAPDLVADAIEALTRQATAAKP